MRTKFTFSVVVIVFSLLQIQSYASTEMKSDSVVLGAGYKNEAYYNMSSGLVQSSLRATWDIAFRTRILSSSIITNDGSGVVLYTYPKSDTSGWSSMDTVGIASWKPMYNDPDMWESGAFSRNATGHPDYGWGKYNSSTHNLTGDSLYIIKLRDGSFKKLWIIGKKSSLNIYDFRFANLDGSNEKNVSLELNPFKSMDYYGYSLKDAGEGVAFQPEKSKWDVVFTKYMSIQPNGTPYPVVGLLNNDTVSTKKFYPVELSYDDFGAGIWDSSRSSIGYNWKYFDNGTFSYFIEDSTVYFVQQIKGDIYKLVFTAFAGSSTGLVKFNVSKAAGAGFNDNTSNNLTISVYPNPASGRINISVPQINNETFTIILSDLSGRQVRAIRQESTGKEELCSMDVTGVQPGIYFVTILTAATKMVGKILINR